MMTFPPVQVACAIAAVAAGLYSPDLAACSCLTRTGQPDEIPGLLAAAHFAFAGEVVDVEEYAFDEHDTAPCFEFQPHHVVVVDVDRVWKGDVPERVSLLIPLGGSSACGLPATVGQEAVFFTQEADAPAGPVANYCTSPNATADTVEQFATSVPPRSGLDDRVEECRRPSPEPPRSEGSCAAGGRLSPETALLGMLLPWARGRRRRATSP